MQSDFPRAVYALVYCMSFYHMMCESVCVFVWCSKELDQAQ